MFPTSLQHIIRLSVVSMALCGGQIVSGGQINFDDVASGQRRFFRLRSDCP